MPDVLSPVVLTTLLAAGITAGVPLMLASLGETIAERSGTLNVGLEGMMLTGAFVAYATALATGDPWLAMLAGGVAGAVCSLVVVVLCIRAGLDQVIVGIGLVLLAEGATSVLHHAWYATSYARLPLVPVIRLPLVADLPVLGGSVGSQPLSTWLAVGLVAVVAWGLRHTRLGLEIRAVGQRPENVDAAGVDVRQVRTIAELTCGTLAGVAGAITCLVGAGTFVPFLTNGAGFIAIVIAMLGGGRPWWCLVGGLLFGICRSASTALQLAGVQVPQDAVFLIPFVAVMVVLAAVARDARLPAALGRSWTRHAP